MFVAPGSLPAACCGVATKPIFGLDDGFDLVMKLRRPRCPKLIAR